MLLKGNCIELLATLPDNSVDSIVTDPPYGLSFMGKSWDGPAGMLGQIATGDEKRGAYAYGGSHSRGYIDNDNLAFQAWTTEWAIQALRVLKPGGHLLAFGGSRTYHRLASAVEDAGFEIRDQIMYLYGSGFPKSLNVTKAAKDKVCQCGVEWSYGTAEPQTEREVRPLHEHDVSQTLDVEGESGEVLLTSLQEQGSPTTRRKESASTEVWGGQSSVEGRSDTQEGEGQLQGSPLRQVSERVSSNGSQGWVHNGTPSSDGSMDGSLTESERSSESHQSQSLGQRQGEPGTVSDQRRSQEGGSWQVCGRCSKPIVKGWGTALKPAHEPIVVARKPLIGTVAQNVLTYGTGALNIDGSRVGTEIRHNPSNSNDGTTAVKWTQGRETQGRWPANVIHDGSDEVLAGFPDTKTGIAKRGNSGGNNFGSDTPKPPLEDIGYADSGSAARFFFNTKSDYNEGLWLDLNLHPNPANNAETSSSLPNQSGDSVLVHALNLALPEGLRCVGLSVELSTTVTANESKRIVEAVMQMTQSIGARFLPESEQPKLTLSSNHAKVVGTLEPTGIMTITASHWKSDGYAEPVTFSITPENSEHGARDSNGKSFIYCAKASKSERNAGLEGLPERRESDRKRDDGVGGDNPRNRTNEAKQNFHPTVKPLALMRYLIKLVTPPGGTVLDPFLGSGSTAVAAILEGFEWIGCEMTEDYFPIIEARVEWAENQPKTLI